jgi:inner membrane protein
MASIGHVALGLVASRQYRAHALGRSSVALSMLFWSALSLLPDVDIVGFGLGVRYADAWGHRGATHSFVFAALVGLLIGALASRSRGAWLRSAAYACAVIASHPLLDTLTSGGLGCALFWPFDLTRYFCPLSFRRAAWPSQPSSCCSSYRVFCMHSGHGDLRTPPSVEESCRICVAHHN